MTGIVLILLLATASCIRYYPSLCDSRVFPLCHCIDRDTKIVCLLDTQPNFQPGNTFTFSVSGDNVPSTAESLVIEGDRRISVVVNEAANKQLNLKHLAFVALAEVNLKADLSQVECLYLLMNAALKFAGGTIPRVDTTTVNDPFSYPGLGLDAQKTGIYLELLSRQCQLRHKFPTGK